MSEFELAVLKILQEIVEVIDRDDELAGSLETLKLNLKELESFYD